MRNVPITVAHGDGIGPEIMAATLHILKEAGARLDIETIEIGEKVYLAGNPAGIYDSAWESLRQTKVFLKAPITTPQGGGYKSLNVTVRKTLGLFANIRPCVSYFPFIETKHPVMDVHIVRENEEDTYAGIEYQQTDEVTQCLKLISRPGCERICRYAFEYARVNRRKKVTCFTKDNIMKQTDGMFHKIFDAVSKDYADIEAEHWIVDIGAAKLADTPEKFDVVVMPNLYGDILSDVAAQIAGSVGLAGSSNIGVTAAMFEAIHGSAPRRAGQNIANPSGLLHGAILMLVHIGQGDVAQRVHNAWLRTVEDGIHTYDVYNQAHSQQKVGTKEFADAVVARLGREPEKLKAVRYASTGEPMKAPTIQSYPPMAKQTVGVDVYLHARDAKPAEIGKKMQDVSGDGVQIGIVTNRGVRVWPDGFPETFVVDHWRCRFQSDRDGQPVSQKQIAALLMRLAGTGLDVIKTENLCTFDGKPAYSSG